MKPSLKYREVLPEARRIVVKIGSRVLVQRSGRPDIRRMRALVQELAGLHRAGREVVVVTSGAVATGREALGLTAKPQSLPDRQMAAAVGQARLMSRYDECFSAAGIKVGQVLLTHSDFHHTVRLTNVRRTMERLIQNRVIPIVNENDVVADEEIRADLALGDNDNLATLLVKLIRADVLILLTTVDGLREKDARGSSRRVRYVEAITPKVMALVADGASDMSRGGMASKLKAAKAAAATGCSVVIANGRRNHILAAVMNGQDVGTLVLGVGL